MSLNGTCQSHITVCHLFFLLIAFYHITHSHSPHYVSFPSPSLCFVSPDGSSLSGHVSRCNLCERTSGCTQMTFRSGVEICWKPVAVWGLKLWLALRLQGPRRCHLVQTWELHCWIWWLEWPLADCVDSPRVSFQQQQLYKSKVDGLQLRLALWAVKNVRGFAVTKKKDLRIFDVNKWRSSDFIADLAMIEKHMIKALS